MNGTTGHAFAKDKSERVPLTDPERDFTNPLELAKDDRMSLARKLELLERWEFTANARLAAGDEGMPVSANREARDSELVRAIGAARRLLQAD